MILETIELLNDENGNLLTINELNNRLNAGTYNDILQTNSFLIFTDKGLVKVNKDKSISYNTSITTTTDNSWTGVQSFLVQPKIIANIDENDNSDNVPTTNWAQNHLSQKSNKAIIETANNDTCVMINNKEIRYGNVSNLTIELPENISEDYVSSIVFTSEIDNLNNFNYPLTIQMSGDDCTDKVFSPMMGKRYTLLLYNDGVNINGVVNGSEVI